MPTNCVEAYNVSDFYPSNLTARPNCSCIHMAMTSMKRVMLEEEGRSAGAETNMPAEVAEKRRKNPPARLHDTHNGILSRSAPEQSCIRVHCIKAFLYYLCFDDKASLPPLPNLRE